MGRAHRSNYVYFVVNLRNAQYAQKCHDPDCAHFRSEWMPLPRALVLQSVYRNGQAPWLSLMLRVSMRGLAGHR